VSTRDSEIIHDWNSAEKRAPLASRPMQFFDETLRDGIQSPSVVDPKIEDKLRLVEIASDLGIHALDIGLPGAGKRAFDDCMHIARFIRDARLPIKPGCAARTVVADIQPIADISEQLGMPLEVLAFIGSSPIRLYAEDWTLEVMLKRSAEAIDFGVKHGLPVTYVTEDTTRSRPDMLDKLFRNAIDHGATRLCLCDTVGHATPDGLLNLVAFAREVIAGTGQTVGLDWHGHNDRGLALSVALWALERGVDRVHGTCLGVGERVGNAPIDLVLLNLSLLGVIERDLHSLRHYVERVSATYGVPVPHNYPAFGHDAFRTATGVHAAAIAKAMQLGRVDLADRVYSSVPAHDLGCEQHIEVGFYSGRANVVRWLEDRGLAVTEERVRRVLERAKRARETMTETELLEVLAEGG